MSSLAAMEDALAQQTILDLARKVGRKAPAQFNTQVDNWMNDRREKKTSASTPASDDPIIQVTNITD
jgi:hypothetical protein